MTIAARWKVGLLCLLLAVAAQSSLLARRNVLFIAVDDMRAELNCYGFPHVHSPHIDGLASQGTLFRYAYCQQAVCNPSRASMLTGLRPDRLQVWDLPTHFRTRQPDIVTLPQLFKDSGYATIGIGKIFHNWRQDEYRGDPASWSRPAVMHYASHGTDVAQVVGKLPPNEENTPRTEMRDVPDEAYFDGRIAQLAVDELQVLSQGERPFFLAVGFWKPHAPFNAPKKYWQLQNRQSLPLPEHPNPPEGVPAIAMHDGREILRGFGGRTADQLTEAEVRTLRHGYMAGISYVDAQIGKVIDRLHELDLAKNTVIVFWSDHGFHLGEHQLWAKTSNFELDARVPLIIAAPGYSSGALSDSLVELLDVYPTLCELCNLSPPTGLDGRSLVPILRDAAQQVKSAAITQHTRPAYPSRKTPLKAMGYSMRTVDYRYTEWRSVKGGQVLATELYDHRADSDETVNLAQMPKYAPTVDRLSQELQRLAPVQQEIDVRSDD